MLRTVIIDDEYYIRDTLINMLEMNCPDIRVVGQASGVVSGIAAIKELQPELVLLDIQMKDGTGFDLLCGLSSIDFKVIFITAYDQYAVQAFRFSAMDYLLKPVNPEQVIVAGEASGVAEGIKAIKELHPDLVLLDINMKDGSGFDLVKAFPEIDFKVIFISAFDKNSIQAFKLSGLEYLMKPVNPEEITMAIDRVMNTDLKYFELQLEALEMNLGREKSPEKFCP